MAASDLPLCRSGCTEAGLPVASDRARHGAEALRSGGLIPLAQERAEREGVTLAPMLRGRDAFLDAARHSAAYDLRQLFLRHPYSSSSIGAGQ
ncbi:hypothetical protein ALP89_100812 [Pseudomonas syringae pv. persicae]|nr:hypothetical protein ALP89_100812 [Pseudomonas syringae pv. persicae]